MGDKIMDNEGEIFKRRALDAEQLLNLAIDFIQSKGLYDEYMSFKQSKGNDNEFN